MKKQKRWKLFVVIAVVALTIYNILPTVFYYSKPLKKEIDEKKAEKIATDIVKRVNFLEKESEEWIRSFAKLLKVSIKSIKIDLENIPDQFIVEFSSKEGADKFKKFLPRAGSLISFAPAQLDLSSYQLEEPKKVAVQRKIPIHFDEKNVNKFFKFSYKSDKNIPSSLYRKFVFDRVAEIGVCLGGVSDTSNKVLKALENRGSKESFYIVQILANEILRYVEIFGEMSPITDRYFSSFTRTSFSKGKELISDLIKLFSDARDNLKLEKKEIKQKEALNILEKKEIVLIKAENILRKYINKFSSGSTPFNYEFLYINLQKQDPKKTSFIDLGIKNPIIKKIEIDWEKDKIFLKLHEDVLDFKENTSPFLKEKFDQIIINEIAKINNKTDEKISFLKNEFVININTLPNLKSFLILKLKDIAKIQKDQIKRIIENKFHPANEELLLQNYPIYDYQSYLLLPPHKKKLCFVIFSPLIHTKTVPLGLKANSIYVIAKGLDRIQQKYINAPDSKNALTFVEDFKDLKNILKEHGYIGYPGSFLSLPSEFQEDYIFEKDDYYQTILKATREDFYVLGSKKFAMLEFSDLEKRILTINKIETSMHEDLLKWKDEYLMAKTSDSLYGRYDSPPPTKNIFLNNFNLSFKKYFRGDERKILHWGLDLSGGKTVQLELRDQNNKIVKDEASLKQGKDELFSRVNKMGVSDVKIRTIDSYITLDFPGAQNISAAELVKASSMYFHVVNEKFSNNPYLKEHVDQFLQEVWNEAIITNKKDIDGINAIARRHLYGDSLDIQSANPLTTAGKILYDNGLRLALKDQKVSSELDSTFSKIAIFRDQNYKKWEQQINPLIIVFNNYSLEGTNLKNIRASYDPSKGNFLSFEIKGPSRKSLYAWTSFYSKESVLKNDLKNFSNKRGWRMAVILNDSVISAPALESPLSNSAVITGSFTAREINKLTADLKAGSMTFTPYILSEKNISPDLGKSERTRGIVATILALMIIIIAIISYYKFSGVVASFCLILNLLIIWAVLQNIQATLTLASIAGVILSIGMAVDANVLIFERIKEEFSMSGKIISAVLSGYKKAYSAILDSNVTTIIAALILLHFDSGPIKGFALTLIIGIVASMFSALFLTKYFFTRWIWKNPDKKLNMMNLIKSTNFDFLKNSKIVIIISIFIILIGSLTVKKSLLSMDFTGGFSLDVQLEEMQNKNYKELVKKALLANGASVKDFQIQELNSERNLRILIGRSMELKGKPFYNLPLEIKKDNIEYPFENNPRISWIVKAINKAGINISPKELKNLDQSWTSMSGQMSDTMRNNAIIALTLAIFAILIYLTFRFEFKFAISAMICLIHDVLITLASISILHFFGVNIQIDLTSIAAMMTIIGYSLNDTIIIFDRIREDMKIMRRSPYRDIINHALNITLSRTSITSVTTLLVVLTLALIGGKAIFGFSLIMILGVIYGTLSSLFIASPMMLFFQKREKEFLVNED
ncbi:MAG: preprotein translocase subunit SecD [Chlamydiae bacterium SM23_39]|nr:MAG: preprotein translocase subunit SecD [Chlamydiae bacterium SM23_39]